MLPVVNISIADFAYLQAYDICKMLQVRKMPGNPINARGSRHITNVKMQCWYILRLFYVSLVIKLCIPSIIGNKVGSSRRQCMHRISVDVVGVSFFAASGRQAHCISVASRASEGGPLGGEIKAVLPKRRKSQLEPIIFLQLMI